MQMLQIVWWQFCWMGVAGFRPTKMKKQQYISIRMWTTRVERGWSEVGGRNMPLMAFPCPFRWQRPWFGRCCQNTSASNYYAVCIQCNLQLVMKRFICLVVDGVYCYSYSSYPGMQQVFHYPWYLVDLVDIGKFYGFKEWVTPSAFDLLF